MGPSLSSKVAAQSVKEGSNPEAARQRISRAQGVVKRLKGLSLPNREAFIYLQEQFGTSQFLANLTTALRVTGSCYGRAIGALLARGGATYEGYFAGVSGLPVHKTKKQVMYAHV